MVEVYGAECQKRGYPNAHVCLRNGFERQVSPNRARTSCGHAERRRMDYADSDDDGWLDLQSERRHIETACRMTGAAVSAMGDGKKKVTSKGAAEASKAAEATTPEASGSICVEGADLTAHDVMNRMSSTYELTVAKTCESY